MRHLAQHTTTGQFPAPEQGGGEHRRRVVPEQERQAFLDGLVSCADAQSRPAAPGSDHQVHRSMRFHVLPDAVKEFPHVLGSDVVR
jgi:hypothetical protein